jgi:23S rRNA pseudouridine2605 synthase
MAEKRPKAKRPRPGKRSPRSPNRHGVVPRSASPEDALVDAVIEPHNVEPRNDDEIRPEFAESEESSSGAERLQKILSRAGVASRRKAEQLILEGRVTVNGKTITELGSKADLSRDHIKVDGTLLRAPKHNVYIALNKPKNCVTTVSDPEGRETVMHLMRGVRERVFPVGRLDYQSEGLLLMTNDGEFAHRITAPSNHVTKVYVVKVNGPLTEEQERAFREGVPMHGRKTAPAEIKMIKSGTNPWYEVKLAEGRQNQIRVMFQNFGRLVEKLRRVKIAFLDLDVPPGRYRSLTPKEIERFKKLLKLD